MRLLEVQTGWTMSETLAGPENVCVCGHTKTWHAWLRNDEMPSDAPLVRFGPCGKVDCECSDYMERAK